MTITGLSFPRITAADGPSRGVLALLAAGFIGTSCQARDHRTDAQGIPCTDASDCPTAWTCVEGTCCATCTPADGERGDGLPAGDGDATDAEGDGSLPVSIAASVSWNNPCQTDGTLFALERSTAGGGFVAISGAPEAHRLGWTDQVADDGTYAYRVLYYCVGPNQNGFLPAKLSPEVDLTPASAPRPLALSITLPTDRSFLAPELEIYRDVNLEHLVYEVSNTLSNQCCTAARKDPCDPTYDESGYWWFANFAGSSYFCQNLPQPASSSPQLVYEAAGGTKTFRTDKHGWAQFTMDTALEEEQGCAITDEIRGGKTWLMYATLQSMARVLPSEYAHLRLTQDLKLNRAELENGCNLAGYCPGWSPTPAIWFMTNETLTAIHPREGEEGNTLFLTVFPCRTNGVDGCDTIDSPLLIPDNTGAYAYIPATDARYQALKPGEWMHYEYDVKDLAEEAIAFFNNAKATDRTLDEYALSTSGGFHFEAWGGFAIDGEYRGQSLKGIAPAEQCNLSTTTGTATTTRAATTTRITGPTPPCTARTATSSTLGPSTTPT